MRRRSLLLAALIWLLSWPALAQIPTTGAGHGAPAGGVSYTGPGDVVSGATAWWGLRGYSAAYSTGSNPAAVICDSATFAICTTINILSNGKFDTATASASSSCVSACVVKSFTDQTGNGATMACTAAASCGTLTFSCIGSLPCVTCAGACVYNATINTLTQPYTMTFEHKYTTTVNTGLIGVAGGNVGLEANNTSLQYFSASPVNITAAENVQNALSIVFNGTGNACASNLNGSSDTGENCGLDNSSSGTTSTVLLGLDSFSSYTGQFEEFGIWNLAFSTTQQTNMNTNLTGFW